MAVSNTNGHHNGVASTDITTATNGHTTSTKIQTAMSETHSHASRNEQRTIESSVHTFSSEQQITVLRHTVTSTRAKLICELAHVNERYIDSMTMEHFLEYIESERLTNMPQRGSRWDKVLKWAEFFALQISGYENTVSSFIPHSKGAAKLIWASCRVLVELGPENSQAIETAFAVLYKVGLSLSFFLQHRELLSCSPQIRTQVGQAFNDLLMLVRDIALHYHIQIRTLSSNEVSLDFKSLFGRNIDAFYSRKDRIIESMWSWRIDDDSINIHAICMWLSVRDATTRTYLGDRAAAKARRDEYTCDWFQRPLLDFTRGEDDVLAITGPSGCGKSMLSGWIMERLQRPIGKKTYQTLSLSVDIELPDQCTSLAISKNLALQLLQSNIGDVALLSALGDIHKKFLGCTDTAILENALWSAIHVGIDNSNADNLAIIVDGLDDRCGRQIALTISNRIAELASKHKRVQAIILTRNAAHFLRSKAHILAITPDHTHFDLQHIAVHALKGCQYYLNQKENEREAVVEKLTQAAKGNFLWVQLMAKILERETSHDGFMKAVKTAHDSPKSLEQLMKSLVFIATADFTNTESNRLLSWLLVSQRPLTVREIKALLEVDIQKKTLVARHSDAEENIRAWCGLLIRIQNGIVHFRHDAIREQLLEISAEGKKLRNYQLLQSDFTVRLLAYCRLRLTNPHSACFDRPEVEGDMFLHDALLEYASRNWIFHFKKSSQYKANGTFELHSDLKVLFPTSVQLPMIEWSCWESQTSGFEAATLHDLALRIRQEILTEKHESVLQTLIICGHLQRKLSMTEQAGAYFYLASRIGQLVLKAYSTITLSCTTAFLEVTETVSCTTRTEFVTHKEECLQYIISVYIHQHGKTSDIVIKYYKMLAELYMSIHEEDKAEMCWKELREIMVIRYGKGSSEETTICGHLKVVLKKGESHEEIIEYERNIFDTTCEMEIWDLRRIEITLKMAVTYEAHGHLLKAEECYVLLWSGLIEYCHQFNRNHHVDIEVHISMIDISLEYVRFLRRHNRHEEAAGILICIWAEYEEFEFESEIVFLRLKVIGELMRSINLLSIAVSVFKKCWSWFKSHGKHEHISSCQILISETIEEIVTTETKSVTTSTTITTTTESIIREVFESSISKSTVTTETISICQSFISLYMKSEQWVEAITASTQSLELIWRLVITGRGTVALPRDFSSEAIDIATRLAICHHRSNHFHEAEEVYLRIYRACFSSCHVHDERFTKAYTCLVKFYEEHGHWDKVVQIYQEILVASRKHLGVSHALTLKILYSLGDLCSKHGHGHAHEYYEEIIAVLNGSSTVCHHESFRAMEIMCRVYYEQGHWEKLRVNCEVLWETWIHHHKSHKIDARFIELLYMRYIYVLEKHYHVEYEVIRRVTIEFRDTCLLVFGASVAITIRALIELAQICTRSEKYIHEAISYYEEVIKITKATTSTTTTTVVSNTTITTVKERLAKAYIHVCSHGSVSSTTIERAISILGERFEYLKITFGYTHTETLTVLRELVLIHQNLKTKESITIVTKILLETTILIISKEKHPKTLFGAAKSIGALYLSCGLAEEGRKMLREMHRQIIFKTQSENCGFKIDHAVGRTSFVFLVTFEQILQGSISISYSKIMADLLTETILYESYSRCIKSEKSIEVTLVAAAKFYVFLEKSSRKEQLAIIQNEIHTIFMKKWGSTIKTKQEISIVFVTSLLMVLGTETRHIRIGDAACRSSNNIVRELLLAGEINKAYEVALCSFQFGENQGAYHHLQNVGYGFKLSALMAWRGLNKQSEKPIEPELHSKMLDLSRKIIGVVLKACKDSKINFVRMKLGELNDLVGLLGEQKNYSDLEWILTSLWSSREVQKHWSPSTIVSLAQLLIQARFLLGQHSSAIKLGEAICYNLRRVYGSLDPKALDMSDMLSRIYIAAGHYSDAMRVHEEILRLVVDGDDADDMTPDTMSSRRAKEQVLMLKQCFLRLKGWDKKPEVYKELVDQLLTMQAYKNDAAFEDVRNFDSWNLKEKPDGNKELKPVVEWGLVVESEKGEGRSVEGGACGYGSAMKNPRLGLKRITSNWGMDIQLLNQDGDEYEDGYQSQGRLDAKLDILVKAKEIKLGTQKDYVLA